MLFSGVDLKELDPRWYKTQIAIVSQEPVLFSGTIRDNICYGLDKQTINDKRLDEVCEMANALVFL